MAGAVPVLYWFDRFESRLGILDVAGGLTHTEELNGEDTVEFSTADAPIKGDRLLWMDAQGTWHEHIVVRTEDRRRGITEVYAENSVCELLDDFIEDKRMRNYTAAAAVANALAPTRWTARNIGSLGTATAVFYLRPCTRCAMRGVAS